MVSGPRSCRPQKAEQQGEASSPSGVVSSKMLKNQRKQALPAAPGPIKGPWAIDARALLASAAVSATEDLGPPPRVTAQH